MLARVKTLLRRAPRFYKWAHRHWLRWRVRLGPRPDAVQLCFFSEFVQSGDLVFDVGANVGAKTALFVALGAKVVAFEPQPECARILAKRVSEPSSVCVVPMGLAAESGTLTLNICSEAPVLSSFSPDWIKGPFADYESDEQVEVEVTTLDAAIQQFGTPQFVKVDVEGYERSVLRGLSKPVRAISYEFHSALIDEALECAKMLKRLGFQEFNLALGEEAALYAPGWLDYSSLECTLQAFASDSAGAWGDVYARSGEAPGCTSDATSLSSTRPPGSTSSTAHLPS